MSAPDRGPCLFVPVLLMGVALNLYLGWQFLQVRGEANRLEGTLRSNAPQVEQSQRAQSDLMQIATVLLQLAQTDPAARAIVEKYGISAQGASASGTNAPAAKP